MVGAADLDQYGTWSQMPEYGAVWYPNNVPVDWAPYRNGYAYDPAYDGYSGDYYAYAAPPRVCITRERVYDPYIGRRVTIQREYRC